MLDQNNRWDKVCDLYSRAMELEPADRASFLTQECRHDEQLLAELEALFRLEAPPVAFLEDPAEVGVVAAPTIPRLQQGDTLNQRFEIQSALGEGGMGEVYRAHDLELGDTVAIKVLRNPQVQGAFSTTRFRREVRLSRRITHVNVCRVFDFATCALESGDPIFFYVMELLEGQTLADRLKSRRPISPELALEIARQLSAGLSAAHDVGIVHRDFKPANIMLCGNDDGVRVVIMDFGLAMAGEWNRPQPSLRSTGLLMGTPGYVAPEQLYGTAATPATDVYCYGIILHELITGSHPRNQAEDCAEPPPEWKAVIERSMQIDPKLRYSSAAEAYAALKQRKRVSFSRRSALVACGVASSGVALSWLGLRIYKQDAQISPGASALIGTFSNRTGDNKLDGTTALFQNQLAQSVRVNVVDQGRVVSTLRQMGKSSESQDPGDLREAGWRLNAALTIFGNLTRVGPDYALNIQVETRGSEPSQPRWKQVRTFTAADPAAVMRSVRDASTWVRQIAGESEAQIAGFDRMPADATTPSWEALSFYAKAERLAMQQRTMDDAVLMLDAALQRDPGFTLAALRRADLLTSLSRQEEGLQQWQAAIRLLNARPATRREELYARGMFAFDTGDFVAAERLFRTWELEYPSDERARFFRVVPLMLNGHARDARAVLDRLIRESPSNAGYQGQMIDACLMSHDLQAAEEWLTRYRKVADQERVASAEARVSFCQGDCVSAVRLYGQLAQSATPARAALGSLMQGLVYMEAGLPDRAGKVFADALARGSSVKAVPIDAKLHLGRAWAALKMLDFQQAQHSAEAAIPLEFGPLTLLHSGTVLARSGRLAGASGCLKRCRTYSDMRNFQLVSHRLEGELARAKGQSPLTAAEFRMAAQLEPALAYRDYLAEVLVGSQEQQTLIERTASNPAMVVRSPMTQTPGAFGSAVRAGIGKNWISEKFSASFATLAIKT